MNKIYLFLSLFSLTFLFGQENVDVKLNVYNFSANSRPSRLTDVDGKILFSGIREVRNGGNELWLYDKNSNKASVVKNFNPSSFDAITRIKSNIAKFNNKNYFIGTENGADNNQLWATDGTTQGTVLIKQLYNASLGNTLQNLFVANGKLFIATDRQLWVSDGTTQGTVLLAENNYSGKFFTLNNKIYFWLNDYVNQSLMVSDGTVVGTKLVKNFDYFYAQNDVNDDLIIFQDRLYFVAQLSGAKSLWKSDGTNAGTERIAPTNLNFLRGKALTDKFIFYDSNKNLWASDGTATNTAIYKTLTSAIQSIFNYKEELYVDTKDGFLKTDGTEIGTEAKIFTDADDQINYYTKSNKENFLFFKRDNYYGYDTWIWKGGNDEAVKLQFARSFDRPTDFIEIDDDIFYPGYSSNNGEEIFRYNFKTNTEKLAVDINFIYDSHTKGYQVIGDNVFFTAINGSQGDLQIYKRNITTGETAKISDFTNGVSELDKTYKVGNFYYAHEKNLINSSFVRSDGSVLESKQFNINGDLIDFFPFNDHAVIYVVNKNSKISVYKLENDSTEPILLKQQAITNSFQELGRGAVLNNELYFIFPDSNGHLSIWKTDGTPENTALTIEFPYENLERLKILGTINSKLIFYKTTNYYSSKFDFYSSDGTQIGTTSLRTVSGRINDNTEIHNNKLFFITNEPTTFYYTDGSVAGTKSVKSVISSNMYGSTLKSCGSYLYGMVDNTLWRTDGTATSTISLSTNLYPNEMVCHKNYMYTSLNDKAQLLRTNGNVAQNVYLNFNVMQDNTDVIQKHQILNPSLISLGSDGKTMYFTGYGDKSDYQQYEVLTELPTALAVNEKLKEKNANNILIFPNPVSEFFSVKVLNNEKIKKIEIIDVTGKLLSTFTDYNNINIGKLTEALYFIKIYTDQNIYNSKLIKK